MQINRTLIFGYQPEREDIMYYDLKESGLRIKNLRRKSGLTQGNLAELVGVSVDMISMLERGVSGGSVDTLGAISSVLGVSVDYIAFGRNTIEIPEDKMKVVMSMLKAMDED